MDCAKEEMKIDFSHCQAGMNVLDAGWTCDAEGAKCCWHAGLPDGKSFALRFPGLFFSPLIFPPNTKGENKTKSEGRTLSNVALV